MREIRMQIAVETSRVAAIFHSCHLQGYAVTVQAESVHVGKRCRGNMRAREGAGHVARGEEMERELQAAGCTRERPKRSRENNHKRTPTD